MGITGGSRLRGLVGLALSAALLDRLRRLVDGRVDAANETVAPETPVGTAPSASPSTPEALPVPVVDGEAAAQEEGPQAAGAVEEAGHRGADA